MRQYTIDLHGMTVLEAKIFINQTLNALTKEYTEVIIVHGYQGGRVLLEFVRKQYNHSKIERKMISFNQGETIFLLKTES